ncbi:retrovirus-related pol polyprotein from transposon TNT 1-94 [Tanacetum coccineum]|uniref:Retrovirus-related pol polyprotein from transposon TNT 1-94 n=1 Tax=Tanacetum coccineum TaxID=301880 RepID=A0ABQ4Z639_9ASTR
MKAEALKEQTKASRLIKALTMYPPNIPATLVPRVLPTKSQVKINIFTFIQLFSEFEKTCKKRITPTGITEGERGFKQTKECYLIEVITFFKTLKEHFESIQKALTKEIKEMKDIFEELEAEVDQNIVHMKHAEIERKNLLIANDNLIADCLSKDVFYITTNSELTISRFTKMIDAHTVVQARCLVLEAELSKFWDKIQTDDHNELVNQFSNLEVNHLNLQLKYQNLKEGFGNNPPPPARETLDFDSVFVIGKRKASLQGKDNIARAKHIEQTTALLTENENLKVQIHNKMQCVTTNPVKPRLYALSKYAIDVKPIPPRNRNNREVHLVYLKHLKESVETIREIGEEAKLERPFDRSLASACLYTKHSQELLEYVQCATSNSNTHKHVEQLNTQKTNVSVPPSTRVNSCTDASRSQPRSNTKKNRILPAKSVNKKNVVEHPRTNKNPTKIGVPTVQTLHLRLFSTAGHTDLPLGDYVVGDSVISRVYYVEGLGHNMFSVGQFCDSDLEVAFRKHSCYVRDTDGVELINGSRGSNLYTISVEDMMKSSPICLLSKASKNKSWLWHRRLNHLNFGTINDLARKDLVRGLPRLKFEKDHLCSVCELGKSKKHTHKPKTENTNLEVLNTLLMDLFPRTPRQNGVVKRRNRTLIEAARTMLIFSKAPMFLWAEAVATACYTQNRSLIHTLHNKTPYELVHDKKPDLTFFRVFGALCYPTNDSEDLGKLQPTTDIGIFVGYAPSRKGYRIYNKRTRRIMETIHVQFDELTEQMAPVQLSTGPAPTFLTPGQISSGLVPNPVPAAPYVPP